MNFNDHSNIKDLHSFLSPSNYHWVNDDEEKIVRRFFKYRAAQLGSELHAFASFAIKNKIKLDKVKKALNLFVNDSIGYGMRSEQPLFYSDYCFGTADAISFKERLLRIFDFKSGETVVKFTQLEVYAAIFCLEYNIDPHSIDIELRIYQGSEPRIEIGDPDRISNIMEKIIKFNTILQMEDN